MTARHNIQASMRATVENWRQNDKKNIGRKICIWCFSSFHLESECSVKRYYICAPTNAAPKTA